MPVGRLLCVTSLQTSYILQHDMELQAISRKFVREAARAAPA